MDPFQPMIEGLQRATNGLVQANAGLVEASTGIAQLAEAMRGAYQEHEDMRETIQRLERLVLDLRDRIDGRQA
jgi:X-X-X-Leu-X-X-Gly heptad repeat protein